MGHTTNGSEERSGEHCLLASIDDATGRITKAVFAKNEGVKEVSKFWKKSMLKRAWEASKRLS